MAPPPIPLHKIPLEFLATEIISFILIGLFCLYIFIKTKEIYDLTKHKGVYYFRYTFFFLAFAYLIRLIHLMFEKLIFYQELRNPMLFFGLGFLLSGFFSSLAILYLASSLVWKKLPKKGWHLFLVTISLIISLTVFLTRSPTLMIILQLLLLLFAIILSYFNFKKIRKKTFFSQLHAAYLLLFLFWIINILAFTKQLINPILKIPMYFFSVLVLGIITFKVHKRLSGDARKKR